MASATLDLTETAAAVLKLGDCLKCCNCDQLPEGKIWELAVCNHYLCGSCADLARSRAECPVNQCQHSNTGHEIAANLELSVTLELFRSLQALLPSTRTSSRHLVQSVDSSRSPHSVLEANNRDAKAHQPIKPARTQTANQSSASTDSASCTQKGGRQTSTRPKVTGGQPAAVVVSVASEPAETEPTLAVAPAATESRLLIKGGQTGNSSHAKRQPGKRLRKRKLSSGDSPFSIPAGADGKKCRVVKAINPASGKEECKLNKKNHKGETLLHVACIKTDVSRVRELLELGADPNTRDHSGWTPLHEVAQCCHTEIVQLLLEKGANPNVPGGPDNMTPLHDAVLAQCVPVVQLLIRYGACKSTKDANGSTPYDLIISNDIRKAFDETTCESTAHQQGFRHQVVISVAPNELSPAQLSLLTSAKESTVKFKFVRKFCTSTTHFLVESNEEKTAQASLEYFMALVSGACIVTWNWFEDSLKGGRWLDEEEYLVVGTPDHQLNAPLLSRANGMKQLPRLLDGLHIYLEGQFTAPYPRREDLAQLLTMAGANVLKRKPDPEGIPENERKLPYHTSRHSALCQCTHLIIYQEGQPKEPLLKYNMQHIKSLPTAWLFQCIHSFSIVDPFR